MKPKDIMQMSVKELESRLVELRKDLMKENAQIALGTNPKSPGKVRHTKKTIARILTIINQKNKNKEGKS